jgi:hypothetical protein
MARGTSGAITSLTGTACKSPSGVGTTGEPAAATATAVPPALVGAMGIPAVATAVDSLDTVGSLVIVDGVDCVVVTACVVGETVGGVV